MLGKLLGCKFINKCNYSLKCINSRLVVITKRKQATVKFLRKDVAKLSSRELNSIVFGRGICSVSAALCLKVISCSIDLRMIPTEFSCNQYTDVMATHACSNFRPMLFHQGGDLPNWLLMLLSKLA
ncbi:hypothetical protein IHE45_20G103300 [Dioscorea alata]|uniref:Uncharacterized protein n=1 Tax=Dioscorea alata TaxID=55571 RepID=A0ACB7TUJ2_DIOAL|nr:hypothetical protein IHE45_20G103300 [Dioscorea alata]